MRRAPRSHSAARGPRIDDRFCYRAHGRPTIALATMRRPPAPRSGECLATRTRQWQCRSGSAKTALDEHLAGSDRRFIVVAHGRF